MTPAWAGRADLVACPYLRAILLLRELVRFVLFSLRVICYSYQHVRLFTTLSSYGFLRNLFHFEEVHFQLKIGCSTQSLQSSAKYNATHFPRANQTSLFKHANKNRSPVRTSHKRPHDWPPPGRSYKRSRGWPRAHDTLARVGISVTSSLLVWYWIWELRCAKKQLQVVQGKFEHCNLLFQ